MTGARPGRIDMASTDVEGNHNYKTSLPLLPIHMLDFTTYNPYTEKLRLKKVVITSSCFCLVDFRRPDASTTPEQTGLAQRDRQQTPRIPEYPKQQVRLAVAARP